jgi:CubicO group peptidase (beta-lactamase class C family)
MAEKVTGLSWESLVRARLFDPLGMNSAGFGPPGTFGELDQPWDHYKSAGRWTSIQADNAKALGPAGTVHCSFNDWAKFIALQLPQNKPAILDREQLNALIEPVGEYAFDWVVVNRPWANGTALTHTGSNTMWFVVVWVAPEINKAFMVGTNSYNENSFAVCDRIIGELIQFDQGLP